MTGDAAGIGGITPAIAAECLEGGFVGESSEVTGPGRGQALTRGGVPRAIARYTPRPVTSLITTTITTITKIR